jgi:hypothetical protein
MSSVRLEGLGGKSAGIGGSASWRCSSQASPERECQQKSRHFGDLDDLLRVPLFHDLLCGPSGNVLVLDSDVSPGKWAFLVLV